MSKHLGKVEQYGSRKVCVKFAAHDYISEMEDASLPVTLMISDCEEFVRDSIDAFRRSQMWDCMSDRDRILSECKYQIFAYDMLGGGLPARKRANMLMDYLEALVDVYKRQFHRRTTENAAGTSGQEPHDRRVICTGRAIHRSAPI